MLITFNQNDFHLIILSSGFERLFQMYIPVLNSEDEVSSCSCKPCIYLFIFL